MSNFIPNDYIKIPPKDHPWITPEIKRLRKKIDFIRTTNVMVVNLRTKWLMTTSGLNVLML